ncbi:MAG TPA: hypothetical protein VEC39_08435 [Vicinamibacterales bacterium]|nr:hypothetical protein [Vicinamibacterales bacterium]
MGPTTALQRPDLGATLEEFNQEAARMGFIADRVAPAIDVSEPAANIGKLPLKALLIDGDTKRNSGGKYGRGEYEFEHFNYQTEEHGREEAVDDRLRKVFARYFDVERIAARRAQELILRKREIRVANLLFNATTWTGASLTTAITNEWDDLTNATPINDMLAAIEKVFSGTGLMPNALILNGFVLRNLMNCAQIVDRIKSAGFDDPKSISLPSLAKLLFPDVPDAQIIVAGAPKNTANPGQAASISRIWSNEYAMVAKVARTNDPREACVARSFHYTADGSELDGRVESYRDETVRGDVIRVRHETDEVVMYTAAAHLLSNITT